MAKKMEGRWLFKFIFISLNNFSILLGKLKVSGRYFYTLCRDIEKEIVSVVKCLATLGFFQLSPAFSGLFDQQRSPLGYHLRSFERCTSSESVSEILKYLSPEM